MSSCIYNGVVTHTRLKPVKHHLKYKTFSIFLDLDGTIYLGGELIPGALDFLERCKQRGIRRFFLSNNSSRSVKQYLLKLNSFGIPATADDVLLSTHVTITTISCNDCTCVGLSYTV